MTDLKALMELHTQATQGDWEVRDHLKEFALDTNHWHGIGSEQKPTFWIAQVEGFGRESWANAHYIAAAANTVPDLIQRLQAAESCLRAIICEINDRTICDSERWCNIEERAKEALTPPTKSEENR